MKCKNQVVNFVAVSAGLLLSGCATIVNDPNIPLVFSFSDGSSPQPVLNINPHTASITSINRLLRIFRVPPYLCSLRLRLSSVIFSFVALASLPASRVHPCARYNRGSVPVLRAGSPQDASKDAGAT